jgi:hypothetical protein
MHNLDDKFINEYTDMILEFPALQFADEITKENFKDILQHFFHELYIEKLDEIQKYLQFRITDRIAEQILRDYGIDPKIISNLNPVFKKAIAYFIERLFQKKGSIEVLQIFNQIFESLFSAINFYRIIVVKQPVKKSNPDGTESVEYLLSYALEPLYINDPSNVLQSFDSKVSLTGKFLMNLEQFKDFKVFPAPTNLIYLQFTSTEVNLDNLKVFETAIRAYALTRLKGDTIPFRNFYGKYFDVEASDLVHIIYYLEMCRKRLINPEFDFFLDEDKPYVSLIMGKENLNEIEKFLHEYKTLKMHDRRALTDFKRKWRLFEKNFVTTTRLYHNFDELEDYIQEYYPEIIDIKNAYLTCEDNYVQFYIDMYLVVLANVDIEDEYINLFINSIFLSIITGESFVQHFFLPVYKIFQKYFFPIEMDFMAKIVNTIIRRSKFDAIAYEKRISMDLSMNAMSKRYLKPDLIKIYTIQYAQDHENVNDKILMEVQNYINDKISKKEEIFIDISTPNKDTIFQNLSNIISIIINSENKDSQKHDDNISVIVESLKKDNLSFNKYIEMTLLVSQSSKQKINDDIAFIVESEFKDNVQFGEKKSSEIDRFNYTQKYGDLKTYLIFENAQAETKSSNLTNTAFKYTRADDQLYFSIHKIF